MDWIVYAGAAAFSGFAGMAMFVTGQQVLEKRLADVTDREVASPEKLQKTRSLCMAGMWLSTAMLAWLLPWLYHADAMLMLRTLLLCAMLWVCAWTDAHGYLIPNRVLVLGLVLWGAVLALHAITNWQTLSFHAMNSLMGCLILGVACLLCRAVSSGAVGWGDIKLVMVMGLYLGADGAGSAMFWAMVCCFVVSVILLATRKVKRDSMIPFAPFLLAGTEIAAILTGI